jgi:hypothetical protein
MTSDLTRKRNQLGWRMPIYAALAAVLVFLPLVISPKTDVLYLFVIVPGLVLIGICVLTYAAMRKKLPIAVMVATFWAVSAVVFLTTSKYALSLDGFCGRVSTRTRFWPSPPRLMEP